MVVVWMVLRLWENWSHDDPIATIQSQFSQSCLALTERERKAGE